MARRPDPTRIPNSSMKAIRALSLAPLLSCHALGVLRLSNWKEGEGDQEPSRHTRRPSPPGRRVSEASKEFGLTVAYACYGLTKMAAVTCFSIHHGVPGSGCALGLGVGIQVFGAIRTVNHGALRGLETAIRLPGCFKFPRKSSYLTTSPTTTSLIMSQGIAARTSF